MAEAPMMKLDVRNLGHETSLSRKAYVTDGASCKRRRRSGLDQK